MKAKILITGGTGLVGMQLTELLDQNGYEVFHLSRSPSTSSRYKSYRWSVSNNFIEEGALDVDFVIHLAGAGIADGRWTDRRKKTIYDSRILSTRLLFEHIVNQNKRIKGFISASAIGFYGADSGSQLMQENSAPGKDFLSYVVQDWELEADKFAEIGIPVAKVRTGIVLSEKGGALPRLIQPIRFGAGAPIGSGSQFMSWIHISDLCRMMMFLLEKKKFDVYNAVAPTPVSNAELTRVCAKVMNRPLILPNVPAFVLKMLFGEMAKILLGGNNVSAQKILDEGFSFEFENIDKAVLNLLG